eukprot:806556-Pleurochrysis_carterae.AAC.1
MEVCATLNQAHKHQIGTQLHEADDGYCYISDGTESLQTEYLAQLLPRRDADGNLKARALDLTMLQSKTSEAQAEAFNESLRETAALLRDVGITEARTQQLAWRSRRRAKPSLLRSAQSALQRPPSARVSTRCRLPSTTPT